MDLQNNLLIYMGINNNKEIYEVKAANRFSQVENK